MGVMIFLSDIMIPLLIFGIVGYGILNRQNIYEEFIDGAKDGFQTVIGIMPTLIGLMVAVGILRASGFLECFSGLLGRGVGWLGFPPELIPVTVVKCSRPLRRPVFFLDIYKEYGADSMLGKMASIMMSSTETIFYTMSVYFMAAGIKKRPLHAGGRADRNHCGNRRKHYPGGIYVSSRRLWLRPGRIFSAKMSAKTEK